MSLLFKNLVTILNTKHRRFYIGGLALVLCAVTSNKVISAELPSVTGLQFQTSGPNRCANIGDWYTTDGAGTAPNCNTNATTSTDKIHRFNIDITQEMIDAAGGAVNITILDAESNGGGGDEVFNTPDPTRFRLLDSSGNQLDSRTVASGSSDGTSVNFSVSSAGTYQITSETGARFINGNNNTGLNDDDNTFTIRVPDAGTDSRLQAQIGQFQGTMQQNTAGDISFSLYFLVGPGTDALRLRNFDLDGRTTLTYRNPSGNSVGNSTISGNANWNGNGNLNTGSDNFPINANTPSFADTGSWTIEVNNLNPNNQFIMEANTGENERLGLYDTRPTRAGNFEITPDTTRTATIDTPVDHPFSVSNNFTTTDIINLSLSGTEPNYTTELINASTGQPLIDTDNDGNLDTGILDPNQTIDLILRVTPTTGLTSNDTTQINAVSHMDLKVDPNNNITRSVTKTTTVFDYGDAPASFDDTADNNNTIDANDNPASHIVTPSLYLGSGEPDVESAPQSSDNADGDDNNNTDDEDAFNTLPNVPSIGNYSLDVPVNTAGNATLHGWIDFDKDGKFEANEYSSASVTSTGDTPLSWSVPPGTIPGQSYARFRLTSDTLSDDGGTDDIDERSVGSASDGEVEDYPVTIEATKIYDYGDAPDTSSDTGTGDYQTTSTNGGAAQVVINEADRVLSLGSEIDADDGSLQNANASADDLDGTPDDEDGVDSFPTLTTTAGQTYTVSVSARNNVAGVPAYLVGFIDFNKDGDFLDEGEQSDTVVVNSDFDALGTDGVERNFDVTFTTPAGMTPGDTYARFRLGQVEATAESATGASAGTDNGEVEDYQVTIFPSGPAFNGFCYYTDRFEWSDYAGSGLPVEVGGITINGSVVNEEFTDPDTSSSHGISTGTQGGEAGNYQLVMGNPTANTAGDYFDFRYTFDPGLSNLSFRLIDVDRGGWIDIVTVTAFFQGNPVPVTLTAEGPNVSVSGNRAEGTGSSASNETLGNVRVDIEERVDTVNIRYEAGTSSGQVIWIGDFGLCNSDYSDNPETYGDARHTISSTSSLHLGTVQPDDDRATSSLASAAADGDDTNNVDDEDAFTTLDSITSKGNYELSVPITNTTGGAAVLHAWIDFDGDGQFTSGEHQQVLVADDQTSANLTWTIPEATNDNSTFSRFRITTDNLVDDGNTAIDERAITAANNGEVEDYPISLAFSSDSNLLLVKRITAINPGQNNEVQFNGFVDYDSDNDGDPNNDPDNDPNWPNDDDTYLRGAVNIEPEVAVVKPGDEVEYTIYFLSNGNNDANNVKVCDVIPDNMSFVANSYDNDSGIALLNSSAVGATPTNLSNAADTDEGTFYVPGTAPPIVGDPPTNLCQKVDSTGNIISVGAAENINGAVVVEIDSLPDATEPGIPENSYGFIRFRAEVQ